MTEGETTPQSAKADSSPDKGSSKGDKGAVLGVKGTFLLTQKAGYLRKPLRFRFLLPGIGRIYEKSMNLGWIFRNVSCIMDAYK